jgi:hypothetical protein
LSFLIPGQPAQNRPATGLYIFYTSCWPVFCIPGNNNRALFLALQLWLEAGPQAMFFQAGGRFYKLLQGPEPKR